MPNLSSFAKVIVVLFLLALVFGYLDAMVNQETTEQITLRRDVVLKVQRISTRTWKNVHWEPLLDFGGEAPILFYPHRLRLDSKENVHVIDVLDYAVKRFNQEGELALVFGLGRGQGPGEFLHVSDFFVSSDGSIWITDVSNSRITVFDPEGKLERVIRTDKRPLRILPQPDGRYLAMLLAPDDDLFEVYSAEGKELRAFGQLIEEQAKNATALEGSLVSGGQASFIWIGWHAGVIASFSVEGDLNYLAETVDPLPWPSIDVARNGVRWPRRRGVFASYSASVSDGKIHILTREDRDTNIIQVLDVYEEATGQYLYSVRLPIQCREAYWYGDHVYTIEGTTVTKWKAEEETLDRKRVALRR